MNFAIGESTMVGDDWWRAYQGGFMSAIMTGLVREREDALMYLPRKGVMECRRGQVIYDEQHPSAGLYLVVKGRVKVSITMEDGSQTVTGVYCADEFFGEG